MNIKGIKVDELRRMKGEEGLILQGCGGDIKEWVDGLNEILKEENILLDGSKFENCLKFENDNLTCLCFPFNDVKIDIGKIAIWRIRNYGLFGGTWLTDFVNNKLGGYVESLDEVEKPDCPLIGQDGNIFNLLGIASNTLKRNGQSENAKKMSERVMSSGDYNQALSIIGEYVNITSVSEMSEGENQKDINDSIEMS